MKRSRAFTLIELLVVISVIALLLSILMPALGRVKKQAQAVVCRSNLKQWGVIFSLYAQDNNDSFPQSERGDGVLDRDAYWMGATLPYYNVWDIRYCPSCRPDPDNNILAYDVDDNGMTFEHWGPIAGDSETTWWDEFPEGSYGINEWCADPPNGPDDTYWGFSIHEAWGKMSVSNAANIPMFLDCAFVDGYPLGSNDPPEEPDKFIFRQWAVDSMRLFCLDRHNETINSVFVDTSVRKIGLKELWRMKWHRTYETHNEWTQPGAVWPEWMEGFKDYSY